MGLIQRLYYWTGLTFGYLEKEGAYEFGGYTEDAKFIMNRLGFKYKCTDHEVIPE